ncbi:MAG TPA: YfhO family protein [Acidimicrobiales bacterium]
MRRSARAGPLNWLRARPALVALLLYGLLSVAFFSPGLLPGHTTSGADYLWSAAPWNTTAPSGVPSKYSQSCQCTLSGSNPELVDPTTVFEPFLQYTGSHLPQVPLWDPHIMGGRPYVANMQSAVFSPFSVPAYVLPFWRSLTVIDILKVLVAAMGAFLLGRALRMGFAGAFMTGAVYGFGLFLVVWLPWPLANVFPLIPWLLLATERLVRRPDGLSAAALAAVVALQFFGGHPESSFHALFAAAAFFVLRVLQGPTGGVASMAAAARQGGSRLAALGRASARPVTVFALALVAGTALAAVTLLPFLELLRHSSDLSARPRGAVYVQPKYFLAVLLPDYWGRATQTTLGNGFEVERAFYAGALPLMLAPIALILRPRVERVAIAVFAAVSVFVVLGLQPFFGIVRHLPGFASTYNTRLTILFLLCVALLAGWGLDDLIRRRPQGRRAWAATALAGGLLVLPVLVVVATDGSSVRFFSRALHVAWGFAQPPGPTSADAAPVIHLASLIVWITLAGAAIALLLARMWRGLAAGAFAGLVVLLVLGDLFRAGVGQNPAITVAHATQPVTPAIQYLQSQQPARYVAFPPRVGVIPLPTDVNLRYGIDDLRGYDFPVEERFGRLWVRDMHAPTPLLPLDTTTVDPSPQSLRILSLFGVRDILLQKGEPPPALPGLRPVYDGPDATILANDGALPRTWLVTGQQVVPGESQQLDAISSPTFDPRRVVVTQKPLPQLGSGDASGPSPGSANLAQYGADQLSINARADRPAELVLSDLSYPGWQATVDGRPARLDRVDYLLRGVPLPAGNHRVELSYHPSSWRVGWIVSLAALAAVTAAAIVGIRGRRKQRSLGLVSDQRAALRAERQP